MREDDRLHERLLRAGRGLYRQPDRPVRLQTGGWQAVRLLPGHRLRPNGVVFVRLLPHSGDGQRELRVQRAVHQQQPVRHRRRDVRDAHERHLQHRSGGVLAPGRSVARRPTRRCTPLGSRCTGSRTTPSRDAASIAAALTSGSSRRWTACGKLSAMDARFVPSLRLAAADRASDQRQAAHDGRRSDGRDRDVLGGRLAAARSGANRTGADLAAVVAPITTGPAVAFSQGSPSGRRTTKPRTRCHCDAFRCAGSAGCGALTPLPTVRRPLGAPCVIIAPSAGMCKPHLIRASRYVRVAS